MGKERMDKFYRQCVARCCRESGMFCSSSSRGVAHATLQARSLRVGRVKSGCGRDTDATRFLAEFLDGLVRVLRELKEKSGRGWRRLPQKVEARGRSNNCRQEPHLAVANASPTAKRSQLDDWSDSPKLLTKWSAAAAPLPALTRTSLGSGPQVPIDLGNPSTWVLGAWPLQRSPIDACLRLPGAPSIVKLHLPAVTEPAASPNNLPYSLSLRQPAHPIPSHQHSSSQIRPAISPPPYSPISDSGSAGKLQSCLEDTIPE